MNSHNGLGDDPEAENPSNNGSNSSVNSTTNGTGSIRRKMSSPMMPAFMVSAPGKVIVFGEHAVVHGKVRCGRRGFARDKTFESNMVDFARPQ